MRFLIAGCLVSCLFAACGGGSGDPGGGNSGGTNVGPGAPALPNASVSATALFTQPHAWTRDVAFLPASPRSPAIIGALNTLGGGGAGSMRIDFSSRCCLRTPG